MSKASSDQSLSLSAAGRKFQLGIVYDANTDTIFESLNLLEKFKNCPPKSRRCPSHILDFKSSYTIDERMEAFRFGGHMKVGVAYGFKELGSASAKYVHNMSSSIGQPRVTLQYKQTTKYEELDTATVLKLSGNHEVLKLAREKGATHFVAGMAYGNHVLIDFKCTKQRDKEHDLLDIHLKGFFSIGQCVADKFNKDNERKITFDHIQCDIFCESKNIKKPANFTEARDIYRNLPTTLQNVEAVDSVYLLPLSFIDKDAIQFKQSDIDEVAMRQLVHIRDDLYEHEMKCDAIGKLEINVSKIKADIQNYTKEMKDKLSLTSPKEWNEVVVKHKSSDFEKSKLHKRIKEESRPKKETLKLDIANIGCRQPFVLTMECYRSRKIGQLAVCLVVFIDSFRLVCGANKMTMIGATWRQSVRTCPDCKKEFSTGREFQQHMMTHTDGRQYKCARCDITFSTESELSAHERTHNSGNKDVNLVPPVVTAAAGATAGAAVGAILGPAGVVAGGLIGGAIGLFKAWYR